MILVTGATGLLGNHLLISLEKSTEAIKAIYYRDNSLEKTKELFKKLNLETFFEKIQWLKVDILDIVSLEEALKNVTKIYHAAGFVSFKSKDAKKLKEINEQGTSNIVNLAKEIPNCRLCHISSISVFNDVIKLKEKDLIDEKIEWDPKLGSSSYAHSKFGSEMEIFRAIEEGLDAFIVNPSIILSPYHKENSSAKLFQAIEKYGKYYPEGSSAFVDAQDVSQCCIWLMNKKEASKERFILSSENISYKELISKVRALKSLSKPKLITNNSLDKIAVILKIYDFISFGNSAINEKLIDSLTSKSNYSNQKIKTLLNFEFKPILERLQNYI